MKKFDLKSLLKNQILPIAIVMLIIITVQLIFTRRQSEFTQLTPQNGILDITDIDFSEEVFTVGNDWNFYPEKLYKSEDFQNGVEEHSELSPNKFRYGTHRLIIKGKPLTHYALCGYSTDYASEVFVDGESVAVFGRVSDKPETSTAKTGYQTIPVYTDENGISEIICQYSNFVHNEGGTIHMTYISTPQNIEEYKTGNNVVSVVLGGGLLILALYFLLNSVMQKQYNYLLLAFCCLIFSLRDQMFAFLSLLPPELPWELGYRMHIAIVNLLPVSILLLLGNMYKGSQKSIKYIYGIGAVFFLMLIAISDTKRLVAINVAAYIFSAIYLIYLLWNIIRNFCKTKKISHSDIISLSGFIILFTAIVIEESSVFHNASMVRYGLSPGAMLVFIFLTAISISLKIRENEIALAESRSRSEMLEKMNNMNIDFLHNVAHELKTPLTVISGYAQLTGMQISTDRINEETPENLKTIHTEALRLADMVTQLMDRSCTTENIIEMNILSVEDVLRKVQAICIPICMKNNNQVAVLSEKLFVYGNAEMLLQVFINLVVNANRHTKNGIITISAKPYDNSSVIFRVKDTGNGIDKENLVHIFEKGFSADNSSGMGLSICADAIKAQNGRIWVEKTSSDGTEFAFTIPVKEN